MTDKDLIKALECCNKDDCDNCPYKRNCKNVMCDVLDLINRQQAEIERLNKEVKYWEVEAKEARADINQAVAEAVKEFATRLEEYSYESMGNYGIIHMVVSVKDIDNLVKEMVGEGNA